ncbi:hypothetical protein J4E83_008258 [Alternaria metachromatica]|uniref:uncharacterized protein n=1 Tax=Alternaria metachromatica TaxID=283354 RepID=UPI0020C312AD|nr:uncharacterized protein J4E83_008258 [Alternaria metachromatica]KAI4610644.1 hypothetical protein J4E83_008258 [Alternaria metachromatica]
MDKTQTQLVVLLAAITAGSVVTFEYLRWSDSRLKTQPVSLVAQTTPETPQVTTHPGKKEESARQSQVDTSTNQSVVRTTVETHPEKPEEGGQESQNDVSANPPAAETTTQHPGVPCHCDPCKEHSQRSQMDTSANRPAMVSRDKENRTTLDVHLIQSRFDFQCSCDLHAKQLYFNWPWTCNSKHSEDDIILQPNSRPTLIQDHEDGIYEPLLLAHRTIEYFSRPESAMDSSQTAALAQWRKSHERTRVLEMLAQHDIRNKDTQFLTDWVVSQLNEIFFFGAIKSLETVWNTNELDSEHGILGDAITKLKDGNNHSFIRLHPTRRCYTQSEYKRTGKTLAEERMGCILHEMLHIFLDQHMCELCGTPENRSSHGRAWQRIARKIEEQSLRLLGIEADVNRLSSFMNDWQDYDTRENVSICDLQDWGFWERPEYDV